MTPPDSDGFRPVGEDLLVRGWRVSFVRAHFDSPDGERFDRDVVRHPGAVAVLPVTDRDSVLLVRQFRASVNRWLLEIPAGCRDVEGEDPALTAQRELEEEAGVRAAEVVELMGVLNTPGFCDQQTILYLATGLTEVPTGRHGPEEVHMEVVEVPWADIDGMVDRGEIVDAETLLALLLARRRLGLT